MGYPIEEGIVSASPQLVGRQQRSLRESRALRHVASLAVAAAWLAMTSCAPRSYEEPIASPLPAADSTDVVGTASLEVINESIFDVRVFVIHAGQFIRLGTVASMNRSTFELDGRVITREFNLYADPVGSTMRQKTDILFVRPGAQITFALEKKMRSYQIAVH
ncbi:MAG: hypothetical protein M3081_07675 [Gemmatimonadota bacterium]|nr:hypothetical protein [Gemmatimonadota bacterium]